MFSICLDQSTDATDTEKILKIIKAFEKCNIYKHGIDELNYFKAVITEN